MRNHSEQASSRADPDGLDGDSPSEATVGEVVVHSGLTAKSGVWTGKVGGALRRRSLAASSRTGQFARSKAWTQIVDFARRAWLLLVAMPVVFVVAILPLAIELNGALQGAVIAAAVASGVWFDVLLVFVVTGSGNQVMGAIGEVWTAQEWSG